MHLSDGGVLNNKFILNSKYIINNKYISGNRYILNNKCSVARGSTILDHKCHLNYKYIENAATCFFDTLCQKQVLDQKYVTNAC